MVKDHILKSSKAELVERLKEVEDEVEDMEAKIEDYREEVENIEEELERRERHCVDDMPVLKQLLAIVEDRGTWHEQEIVRAVMNGDGLDKDDRQRVKLLAIQFLHQTIL